MKIFVAILLLISFFSPLYANTIFYLTKIPNLEIYDLNSSNNIKYLTAKKAFRVGFRENNVQCDKTDKNNIKKKFDLIKKNFDIYDKNFLKKINLKYVVLCENLSVSEIRSAGVPNYKMKTLVIDIKFNKKHFERVIHHEVFHLINDSYKNLFNYKEWSKFNETSFKYAKCSTCSDRLDLNLLDKTKGFLTEYSTSTASEDMAELFSFLIIDKDKIKIKALKDPILSKKISFLEKKLLKIDTNFKF